MLPLDSKLGPVAAVLSHIPLDSKLGPGAPRQAGCEQEEGCGDG